MTDSLAKILQETDTEPQCKTCRLLLTLSKADRVALTMALLDPEFSHTRIATALTRAGYKVSEASIRRHRRNCRDAEGSAELP